MPYIWLPAGSRKQGARTGW